MLDSQSTLLCFPKKYDFITFCGVQSTKKVFSMVFLRLGHIYSKHNKFFGHLVFVVAETTQNLQNIAKNLVFHALV